MRWVLLGAGGSIALAGLVLLARSPAESTAELWASIDTNSIVGFGSLIENKVDPDLWTDVVLPVLTWPAWVLPLALAALLILVARPWRLRAMKSASIKGDSRGDAEVAE